MTRSIFSIPYTLVSLWAVCSALPSAASNRRDVCIWPGGPVDGTLSCTPVFKDKKISGIEYNIYRYPEVAAEDEHIKYVEAVLDEISSLYTSFLGDAALTVSIHMVQQADTSNNDLFAVTIELARHCYIRLGTHQGTTPRSERSFKATVAHEMYHCIQHRLGPQLVAGQVVENAGWWAEGSAVFMSNYFYPDLAAEVGHINGYDPTLSIVDSSNTYPAGIIFQYLFNAGWSVEQINTWVLKQQRSWSAGAEMSRIAADEALVAAWPHFATAFVDATISWRAGDTVKPLTSVPLAVFSVPEGQYDKEISVLPFQIHRYRTTLPVEKTVTMTFTPDLLSDTKTVLQYRQGNSGPHKTATPGEKIELQNQCHKEAQSWEFLLTSTNDPASLPSGGKARAKLSFSTTSPSKKRQESESCENDPDNGLDSCLIGSWTLDLAAMQEFLREKLGSVQEVSVSNLAVSGSSALTVDSNYHSVMKFDPITISYDGSSEAGVGFHTDMSIQGSIDGTIVTGAQPSSFTWDLVGYASTGSVHTITYIPALELDLPLDFPVDSQYSDQTQVQYTCSGSMLQMTGFMDDSYVWAYTWVKAEA